MAKCSKCGQEIPNTGEDSPNWKLYCKKCVPSISDLLKCDPPTIKLRREKMVKVDLLIGDRVRIKRGQPWAEEFGTYIGAENTLAGLMYKIKLDNGFTVLQTRGHFITHPIEQAK